MKYIKESKEVFNERELVIYDGDIEEHRGKRARVRKRDGDKYTIMVMPGKDFLDVDVSELKPVPRCIGRCNKQVVDIPAEYGGGKGIYCFGCERPINRL